MLLQGHNWDKNTKADIKEDIRVEWIFLALDNKWTVNTVISTFHSQKVWELVDKVNEYKSQKWHC
jgi:hypothetical protein